MDWNRMKNDYVNHNMSLHALAKKYGVSYSTIQGKAKRENWNLLRMGVEEPGNEVRKAMEALSLRLLKAVDRAVGELDNRRIVTKTKVKTEDGECTTQREYMEPGGSINCQELKILTAALKDIRDIQMIRPPLDIREQEAKIRNLERQWLTQGAAEVTVTLAADTEGFAV